MVAERPHVASIVLGRPVAKVVPQLKLSCDATEVGTGGHADPDQTIMGIDTPGLSVEFLPAIAMNIEDDQVQVDATGMTVS